jgi:mono/diheme cytochrome c family protein
MKTCRHTVALTLALALVPALMGLAASAVAATKTFQYPAETAQLKPSALPGYAKAQAQCVACHSAEYMLYQPPTAGRAYWDAMVKRMKAVFKAPVDDADIPLLVDYLVKTYGNEQPK